MTDKSNISVLARIMSMRATQERKPRGPEHVLFSPYAVAMRSNRQRVEITLLDEPDDTCHVQIEHEGQQHKMYLSGVVLWELRKWAAMNRPLKNTVVVIRYRHGAPRPEVDIYAGSGPSGSASLL